jgi:hypothetical protein
VRGSLARPPAIAGWLEFTEIAETGAWPDFLRWKNQAKRRAAYGGKTRQLTRTSGIFKTWRTARLRVSPVRAGLDLNSPLRNSDQGLSASEDLPACICAKWQ